METQSIQGIVTFKSSGLCTVAYKNAEIECHLSTHLYQQASGATRKSKRKAGIMDTDPLAVGDHVFFNLLDDGKGLVTDIVARKNQLSRRAASPKPGGFPLEQVIAANVDQVVAVMAVSQPAPRWNLLDRYLANAEAAGLPALVCLTKSDLLQAAQPEFLAELEEAKETYAKIGYQVVETSSTSGAGLSALSALLSGKTSILLGKSGVGKTSLLNKLVPDLDLRVKAVSQLTGKGRHTTSAAQLLPVDERTAIIDTPGTREFGLWDVDPMELDTCFPEMQPYIGKCKFRLGCQHEEEPGCEVRRAVMDGHIHPRRYQSYIRLKEDYLQ